VSEGQSAGHQPVVGIPAAVGGLEDVQGRVYDQPTILLAECVTGFEDIPDGTVAVITRDSVDVLSHVAIRARSQGAMVACCSSSAGWEAVQGQLPGTDRLQDPVAVQVANDGTVIIMPWKGELPSNGNRRGTVTRKLAEPVLTDRWVLHVSFWRNACDM
jgi:hypothetical protein